MKPDASPALWIGEGKLIRPGLTALGAKTKLYEEGFELLGTGACASAFQLGDSDRCVKLVCDRAGHRAAVQMFRDHPEVDAFPRIYGYAELAGDCFAYETELLEEADSYDDYQGDVEDDEVDWDEVAAAFGIEAAEIMEATVRDNHFEHSFEGWRALYFDLHNANYMARPGDGSVVIIDPFHLHHDRDAKALSVVQGTGRRCWGRGSYWSDVQWRAKRRGPQVIEPVLRAV